MVASAVGLTSPPATPTTSADSTVQTDLVVSPLPGPPLFDRVLFDMVTPRIASSAT